MKKHLLLLAPCLAICSLLTAQSGPVNGDLLLQYKGSSGAALQGLTPSANDVLSWNGSGRILSLPRSTFAPASHTQAWSTITGTPTTLAGYGIADSLTATQIDNDYLPRSAANEDPVDSTVARRTDSGGLLAKYFLADEESGISLRMNPNAIIFRDTTANKTLSIVAPATPYADNITLTIPNGGSGSLLSTASPLDAGNITTGTLTLNRINQGSATTGQVLAWNGSVWAPATAAAGVADGDKGDITVSGTGAVWTIDADVTITRPKVGQISDSNGNEMLLMTTTASAVNEVTLSNAATGGYPILQATGADTNIALALRPKGTADVRIGKATNPILVGDPGNSTVDQLVMFFGNSNGVALSYGMGGVSIGSTARLNWTNGGPTNSTVDLRLARDAANILAQANGTNAQTYRLYETDSGANDEYLQLSAASGTNSIKPVATGTGTASKVDYYVTSSVMLTSGTGTPEGAVTAPVGSLYLRTDGGAATTLYVKESGTGNTGWIGK